MIFDYSGLDLPVHPGDTVYAVFDKEDRSGYEICEETIASILLSQDNTLQFVIEATVEEFGPDSQVFITREEAENYIKKLEASLPRHIELDYRNCREWFDPKYYLPADSRDVLITTLSPLDKEPDHSIYGYYIRESDILPEGFYLLPPSAFDNNYDIIEESLTKENAVRIPDERIYAWRDMEDPVKCIYNGIPLK